MALQLLKRNYTMDGYERPKILKLSQPEFRSSPRRLPVDVGDVLMQVRMNSGQNKYIGEHVSKYSQGLNPYGQFGYPYKINKNNIRPPIIDPKYYQPLSRMPVKFDSVTAGPIVSDLYKKKIEIAKVAPRTIIDRVCPDVAPTVTSKNVNITNDGGFREGSIQLHINKPRASIPYHPSIPVYINRGVPEVELDPKIYVRPNMGIHAPFNISDQSRDVNNMRTPSHVAVKPGYKVPTTIIQPTIEDIRGINEELYNVSAGSAVKSQYTGEPDLNRDVTLVPQLQTSAWYNPSYFLADPERQCDPADPIIANRVKTARNAPVSYRMIEHQGGQEPITTREALQLGEFSGKAQIPIIQEHQEYNRIRESFTPVMNGETQYLAPRNGYRPSHIDETPTQTGIRNRLQLQQPRENVTGLEPNQRINPVGTGRFVKPTTF